MEHKDIRLLYTSDIHAHPDYLSAMLAAARGHGVDAVLVGGDIIPHHLPGTFGPDILEAQVRYLREIFLPALDRYRQERKTAFFLDLGNDDFAASRTVLEERDGSDLHLIHMAVRELTPSVDAAGYMMVPPTPFGRKDWEKPDCTEQPWAPGNRVTLHGVVSGNGRLEKTTLDPKAPETLEADLERLSAKIRKPFLFVSHAPPYGTPLDLIYDGTHVGSLAVRRFIEHWARKGWLLGSFHGHIHESYRRSGAVRAAIEGAPCFNPGQGDVYGGRFRYLVLRLQASGGAVETEMAP